MIKFKLLVLISRIKRKINQILYLIFGYKFFYILSFLRFKLQKLLKIFSKNNLSYDYDLVFILTEENRKWILGKICQKIADYFSGTYTFLIGDFFPGAENIYIHHPIDVPSLPRAQAYFFAHYYYYVVSLKLYPQLWQANTYVFYTHARENIKPEEIAYIFNNCSQLICMNSQSAKIMMEYGVNQDKVTYVIAGADPEIFQPHQRTGEGAVGFCTAYYPRKAPERIVKIIKMLPHRKFILLGKDWETYGQFDELTACKNLSYIQTDYAQYADYYAQMDVFVSVATTEGGPIPLIEAMMCNVVPVATKTGFAPDLIIHGENGYLVEVDSAVEIICEYIEKAFENKTDIHKTCQNLTWQSFSENIHAIMNISY